MPEIPRFYGIRIRMFSEVGQPPARAHVHAYFQAHVAVFGIDPTALIAGSLPRTPQRLAAPR
ncbi:MAG: DUF4160 domain-containing protein [Deferrisomatales bacterium]